ncbi:MAG: hypothetical protein L6R40_008727 [Gallowayella cf. fulva]|nr:MAG: hypothetical protein L6R40_008727 [Xanthomendoza cf. fulva]
MARTLNPMITPELRDKMINFFDEDCKYRERIAKSSLCVDTLETPELLECITDANDATLREFGFRIHISKNRAKGYEMNAIDLAKNTVKALNVIARDLGMKRYSALRKADLIAAIVEFTYQADREAEIAEIELESTPNVKILDVDEPADHDAIAAIVAEFAVQAPVKAPESHAKALPTVTLVEVPMTKDEELSELLTAYHSMKATWNRSTGALQIKLTARLKSIRAQVKALGYNPIEVRMGYAIG